MKKSEQLKINIEVLTALFEFESHEESLINKVRLLIEVGIQICKGVKLNEVQHNFNVFG